MSRQALPRQNPGSTVSGAKENFITPGLVVADSVIYLLGEVQHLVHLLRIRRAKQLALLDRSHREINVGKSVGRHWQEAEVGLLRGQALLHKTCRSRLTLWVGEGNAPGDWRNGGCS
jgi:hypothetical protein